MYDEKLRVLAFAWHSRVFCNGQTNLFYYLGLVHSYALVPSSVVANGQALLFVRRSALRP